MSEMSANPFACKPHRSSVDLEELIEAMRKIKTVEDDPAKFDRIGLVLAKLDDNKDGKIEVDDLVKVRSS